MWLITGIFDTLVAKTSYVSSHIRSCLKLHKSTRGGGGGVTHVSLKKKTLKIGYLIIHLYGPPTPSIYIMWLGKICPCTRCLVHILCALILHAYLNRKNFFFSMSKSLPKGGNPDIMKIKICCGLSPWWLNLSLATLNCSLIKIYHPKNIVT